MHVGVTKLRGLHMGKTFPIYFFCHMNKNDGVNLCFAVLKLLSWRTDCFCVPMYQVYT